MIKEDEGGLQLSNIPSHREMRWRMRVRGPGCAGRARQLSGLGQYRQHTPRVTIAVSLTRGLIGM